MNSVQYHILLDTDNLQPTKRPTHWPQCLFDTALCKRKDRNQNSKQKKFGHSADMSLFSLLKGKTTYSSTWNSFSKNSMDQHCNTSGCWKSISFSSLKKGGGLHMTNIASHCKLSDKIFVLDTAVPRILFSMLFSKKRIFFCRKMAAYYAVKSSNDRRAKKEAFDKIFARFDHNHNGGISGLWLSSF